VLPPERLRNAKLVFRTSCVIDARQSGIYRGSGAALGDGGRPPEAERGV
jgi:hypothetical protein